MCEPQPATDAAGFIFGAAFGSILALFCVLWMILKGHVQNEALVSCDGFALRFPRCILAWRFVVVVFCFVVLGTTITSGSALLFYTIWNWLLLCLYFLVAFTVSLTRVVLPGSLAGASGQCFRLRDGRAVGHRPAYHFLACLQILGEIEAPMSLLVTIVFWAVLSEGVDHEDFGSISMHLVNCLVVFVDLFLSEYLFNANHVTAVLLFAALYLLFHLTQAQFTCENQYDFLDTDDPVYIAWSLGLALGVVLLYFIYFGFSKLKELMLGAIALGSPVKEEHQSQAPSADGGTTFVAKTTDVKIEMSGAGDSHQGGPREEGSAEGGPVNADHHEPEASERATALV